MSAPARPFPIAKEAVPGVLEAHGILPTAQRVEIAALLLSAGHHWSADEMLGKLKEKGAAVSKATVYNTLGLFAERGLVREVIADPTKTFYDSNTSPHHHYYNVDDGTLTDIVGGQISLEGVAEAPWGTYMERVDVVLRIRNQR